MKNATAPKEAWLAELKEGFQVILSRSSAGRQTDEESIQTVDKLTPTQIVIGHFRFRRSDGYEVGDGYHKAQLKEATQEDVARVRNANKQRRLAYDLNQINFNGFSLDSLQRIEAAIELEQRER